VEAQHIQDLETVIALHQHMEEISVWVTQRRHRNVILMVVQLMDLGVAGETGVTVPLLVVTRVNMSSSDHVTVIVHQSKMEDLIVRVKQMKHRHVEQLHVQLMVVILTGVSGVHVRSPVMVALRREHVLVPTQLLLSMVLIVMGIVQNPDLVAQHHVQLMVTGEIGRHGEHVP